MASNCGVSSWQYFLRMPHDELPKDVVQIMEHEGVGAQDVT
jgi:hypothetical protein